MFRTPWADSLHQKWLHLCPGFLIQQLPVSRRPPLHPSSIISHYFNPVIEKSIWLQTIFGFVPNVPMKFDEVSSWQPHLSLRARLGRRRGRGRLLF